MHSADCQVLDQTVSQMCVQQCAQVLVVVDDVGCPVRKRVFVKVAIDRVENDVICRLIISVLFRFLGLGKCQIVVLSPDTFWFVPEWKAMC